MAVTSPAAQAAGLEAQWFTSLELDFGPVAVGADSLQMVVTITNTGSLNIIGWVGGAVGAPFNATQDCVIPDGLAPGACCHFYYNFSPTSPGFYSATSTFSTNAGKISIKLQGSRLPLSYIYMPMMKK